MFDQIGPQQELGATRRQLEAAVWSCVVTAIAAVAIVATRVAPERKEAATDDVLDVVIELAAATDEPPEAPPKPPPIPAAVATQSAPDNPEQGVDAPAAAIKPDKRPDEPDDDDDALAEPEPPTKPPVWRSGLTVPLSGAGGKWRTGADATETEADESGQGEVDDDASGLAVVNRYRPPYPRAAGLQYPGVRRCEAEVDVDALGRPTDVRVIGGDCPKVFQETTIRALKKWTWVEPPEGSAVVAVTLVYKLDGPQWVPSKYAREANPKGGAVD